MSITFSGSCFFELLVNPATAEEEDAGDEEAADAGEAAEVGEVEEDEFAKGEAGRGRGRLGGFRGLGFRILRRDTVGRGMTRRLT